MDSRPFNCLRCAHDDEENPERHGEDPHIPEEDWYREYGIDSAHNEEELYLMGYKTSLVIHACKTFVKIPMEMNSMFAPDA